MRGSFPPIRRSATVALAFGALLVACGEAPPGAAPQAPADLAREIEKAISLASPLDRLPLLASLLQGLDAGSVDAVVGAYAKHDPPATEYELLVEAWVRFDPRGPVSITLQPQQRCPYCHGGLGERDDLVSCLDCRTPHHRACAREAGRCTTRGCRNTARPRR